MKKEIANLWIAALRSGNYKQGNGLLRDLDNNYCALGVLAELAVLQKGVTRTADSKSFLYGNFRESLPPEVVDWAKLRNPNGYSTHINQSITNMNDKGKTFEEIATVIQNQWKDL